MSEAELYFYAVEFRRAIIGRGSSSRMCAAIAAPLSAALELLGTPNMLMESDLQECNHVFLQLENGMVLDPTADQFLTESVADGWNVYLGVPLLIHGDAQPFTGQVWVELMHQFKRMEPNLRPDMAGQLVRSVLRTLPSEFLELPSTH